ncbi:MAG TPA: ABC transporter ATP-binding protein [Blastocatellia bacterium]|nr:ABC transporter ATP-binding protein [Blastocatellia bacterium]
MSVLVVEDVRKTYAGGETPVTAVRGVSFTLEAGDFVALMGPSGCGKSTLLHLCGAMDRPTSGRLTIAGVSLSGLNDDSLTRLRRERVGFIFQFFNLLPTLTVEENIALPLLLAGRAAGEADRWARVMADRVGLGHRLNHFPSQLSGGEMQRAAIARAIIHSPALLIADEPTGSLDSDNSARILQLLANLNRELRVAILLATHDAGTADFAERVMLMRDGLIESVEEKPASKHLLQHRER